MLLLLAFSFFGCQFLSHILFNPVMMKFQFFFILHSSQPGVPSSCFFFLFSWQLMSVRRPRCYCILDREKRFCNFFFCFPGFLPCSTALAWYMHFLDWTYFLPSSLSIFYSPFLLKTLPHVLCTNGVTSIFWYALIYLIWCLCDVARTPSNLHFYFFPYYIFILLTLYHF